MILHITQILILKTRTATTKIRNRKYQNQNKNETKKLEIFEISEIGSKTDPSKNKRGPNSIAINFF